MLVGTACFLHGISNLHPNFPLSKENISPQQLVSVSTNCLRHHGCTARRLPKQSRSAQNHTPRPITS